MAASAPTSRTPTVDPSKKADAANGPEILLDAGTNEVEVLVFAMGEGRYGVNVAKVREVIRPVRTVESPGQHPAVIGIINLRGVVIPVVDLALHLGLKKQWGENGAEGRVIITEFNGRRSGFMVDAVEQIHRMSWQKVRPAPDVGSNPSVITSGVASFTTGVIEIGGHLVLMIDFESVADSVLLQDKLHVQSVPPVNGVDRANRRVILVEDSPFMRKRITEVFTNSGYTRLEVYPDGQSAWEAISAGGPKIDAVISDIEMPRMDGLHLTRRIKEAAASKDVPVVLFSSLISEDNRKKGQQVGADVQIPKPELPEMVRMVDRVIAGERVGVAQTTGVGAQAA
jgi:two-component system chemotaxis response regulator CheV